MPEFNWDRATLGHTTRHEISPEDVADVFDYPYRIEGATYAKRGEVRYGTIASTADRRILYVVYGHRDGRVRVVTARFAHRRELRDDWAGRPR